MIDPDDTEALTVIGNSSYNELMTRLIDYQESTAPDNKADNTYNNSKHIHDNNVEQALVAEEKSEDVCKDSLIFDDHNSVHVAELVDRLSLNNPTAAAIPEASFPPPPPPTPVSACDLDLSPADVIHPTDLNLSPPDVIHPSDLNVIPTDLNLNPADVIQHFLFSTSSQLTPTGLQRLHTVMSDRELAVIFRNNHFSTLFSYEGSLYTLVTDIGYLHIPRVVWEKLDTVDGYV